jgi:hypothetical protein
MTSRTNVIVKEGTPAHIELGRLFNLGNFLYKRKKLLATEVFCVCIEF